MSNFKVEIDAEIQEIVPGFLERTRNALETCKNNLDDVPAIEVVGHKLAGTGGSYGFDLASELGSKLEDAAKETNSDDISSLLDELINYFGNLEITYI
jgi:histidine phosphotransfer protein HptB